ncbi:HK97 gp10 family phage protein [Brachybacterium sp. YJGR34]|uniref:HK97 gp10 family phage protein n=1 Tax=Brachybacterium sp. YJGR34 TaxID=2059911 RepID=UPI000E0B77E3|nr:HK97 gp10 family phage protein [Brachybacterium sp. YJGR34]
MAERDAGIRIEGQRELRKTLRQAGDDLEDLKAAHKAAAEVAAGGSKPLAPVRTGNLASTIRAGGTKTSAVIRAGKKRVPYAGPIHWGWESRGIEPTPFLADGAKNTEPQWVELFYQALDKALKKVKGT